MRFGDKLVRHRDSGQAAHPTQDDQRLLETRTENDQVNNLSNV